MSSFSSRKLLPNVREFRGQKELVVRFVHDPPTSGKCRRPLARGDSDVYAGYKDEGSAEEHIKAGLVVPDEIGEECTGNQLGVVILCHVGRRSVLDSDVEAERAERAEEAHGEETEREAERKGRGMYEGHQGKAGDRRDDAGKESEALRRFRLGEHTRPDHIGGEAGDADHAGGETDPVTLACAGPWMHSNDDSGESCDNGRGPAPGHAFA